MSEILPEGTLIEVSLTVRLPAAATDEQIQEWLNAEVASFGGMGEDNPLWNDAVESWANNDVDWSDTGRSGREETYDHEDLGDGRKRWKVRYISERREALAKASA